MKKVIAILAIATTLVSCGGGVSNNPTTDSTTVTTDSTAVIADSTTVKADTTAAKVEEVK